MPICENCKKEIDEETTYVYTMESPTGGVNTQDLCPRCAKAVIHAVRKTLQDKRKISDWWAIRKQEYLYDDIPGEVL